MSERNSGSLIPRAYNPHAPRVIKTEPAGRWASVDVPVPDQWIVRWSARGLKRESRDLHAAGNLLDLCLSLVHDGHDKSQATGIGQGTLKTSSYPTVPVTENMAH